MNSEQRRNNLRKTTYIQRCKKQETINLLGLSIVNQNNIKQRSTEHIFDSVSEYHKQENDLVNLLLAFKRQLDKYPTDSIDNRCLPKTYIQQINKYL